MSSDHLNLARRQIRTQPSQCRICDAPALYSYFGTICCQSCKMFFKRNGERGITSLKCDLDGECEIGFKNRRTCSYCRLQKCFRSGMRSDMIRSPRNKKSTNRKKVQRCEEKDEATSTALLKCEQINRSIRFPTLNLVQSDLSNLSRDQWDLLSNLVHCYDEHSGCSFAKRFIAEQNSLPIKMRYKSAVVGDFLALTVNHAQTLFDRNQDFQLLSSHDQSILLNTTALIVASLSVHVVLRQVQLMDQPSFFQSHEILFGPVATKLAKRLYQQVDCDTVVMKLILAILSFSTTNCSIYKNAVPENLIDTKKILRIQDTYTDILWRYLIYKYNHEQAVKRFIVVIQCIFSVHSAIMVATEVQWYADVVDTLIEQTKCSLTMDSSS